ncbi:MAG: single-stranded-DNA-specific exonuclease RecJ [Alphaproteobacteria bacterium]|nr:single-stranded-DNA-specific exonuclease RecJ [Alphaproteobacteria bacterium]
MSALAEQHPQALLNVSHSAMGYRWQLRPVNERALLAITQQLQISEILARILVGRGLDSTTAEDFLAPTLRNLLPDPSHLLDMDKAAERLAIAIANNETIAIFGDYDVDGATSAALLFRYLRATGVRNILIHIPDRIIEGYGPNSAAMQDLKARGASLVITVDCGAVSFAPLADAAHIGLDVIVMDHHIGDVQLPQAVAVVNPNRFDETSEHKHMAAVGVCFLFVVATNRVLRAQGHSEIPNPLNWLDLVALGTVCDVVALQGVNRAFVSQGIRVLAERRNIGLAALADVAGMDEMPAAYHLGFMLGPRINAGGRVGKSDLGVRLLTTEDAAEAVMIAEQLNQHNAERKTLESLALDEATALAESRADSDAVIVVEGNWHPGVIGIVAGRLKDKFHKPVAVIAREGELGKASARSVSGVDFGAAVVAARSNEILQAGGGHAMAAGFTVALEKVDELRDFFNVRLQEAVHRYAEKRALTVDAVLSLKAATGELLQQIKNAEPFGMGNASPRFAFANLQLVKCDLVGENHLRCIFTDGGIGGKANGGRLQAIAFRAANTPLEKVFVAAKAGALVHVVGQLKLNSWNGVDRVDLHVEDAQLAHESNSR